MHFTQQRWCTLSGNMNIEVVYEEFQKLKVAYSGKHRAYHTIQHVSECLEKLDWARSKGYSENLPQIEMALWYHDAVYNPRSKNNECDSADLCRKFLNQTGVNTRQLEAIYKIIMVTQHTSIPGTPSEQLVVDIDLVILGADEKRFAEYEAQIRQEYNWVPWFLYKKKRREVLQSFLQRQRIFSTNIFYEAYEEQARSNILNSIQSLN